MCVVTCGEAKIRYSYALFAAYRTASTLMPQLTVICTYCRGGISVSRIKLHLQRNDRALHALVEIGDYPPIFILIVLEVFARGRRGMRYMLPCRLGGRANPMRILTQPLIPVSRRQLFRRK
jgi:hypothetical protein